MSKVEELDHKQDLIEFYNDLLVLEKSTNRLIEKYGKKPEDELYTRSVDYLRKNEFLREVIKRQLKREYDYDI